MPCFNKNRKPIPNTYEKVKEVLTVILRQGITLEASVNAAFQKRQNFRQNFRNYRGNNRYRGQNFRGNYRGKNKR